MSINKNSMYEARISLLFFLIVFLYYSYKMEINFMCILFLHNYNLVLVYVLQRFLTVIKIKQQIKMQHH